MKETNKTTKQKTFLKKNSVFYWTLLIIWIILLGVLWYFFINSFIRIPFYKGFTPSATHKYVSLILLILDAIFISYFWLNGAKDLIYIAWYFILKKKILKKYFKVLTADVSNVKDKVLLVYCTCNDFNSKALSISAKQNYSNFDIVILDDSTEEEQKKEIDEFASANNIKVVRREGNEGFKAGNINNYLLSKECKELNYDYYLILDSDEIIPNDFITEALKYFYTYENIGVLQANHISTNNSNFFMKTFHLGVNSHWPTYQTMKNFYGFSSMLGHGALLKKECYEKVGGFPHLVAEDLCLSIEARKYGYLVVFAPNIICQEEYPIDYVAFKKRHSKWTQGNLEFIKKYTKVISKSKMHWFEKMDIVLFTYNLPLTAIFAFYIFMNLIFLPLLKIDLIGTYNIWLLVITIIFFFSPMFNDIFTWIFRINIFRFLFYMFWTIVLYGSMLLTSLISATLGLFGKKAKFIVTPKKTTKYSIWVAFKISWKELIFGGILITISLLVSKSPWPVILIVLTAWLSFFLVFFSNKKYTEKQIEKIDKKTSLISKNQNFLYVYQNKIKLENNTKDASKNKNT